MANLFGLGFLKGAATGLTDQIDKRQEFEREQRKQELLTRLRVETQKEVADYEELLRSKRADDKQSGFDEERGKYVIRNDMGQEIGARDITSTERQGIQADRDKTQQEAEYKRAQIDNLREDNAISRERLGIERMNAATNRMNANTNSKGASGGLDATGDNRNQSGSFNVGSEIIRANDKIVADLIKVGVPAEEVTKMAARAAANAKARKQDFNAAQQYFVEGARFLREGANELAAAKEEDPGSKKNFGGTTVEAVNKYRTSKGLENYGP